MSEKWINVNDQLPPIGWTMSELVLVTDGECIGVGWYHMDDGWCCDTIPNLKPTHWLPIPEWHKKDYTRPTLVYHCAKCGKPYMIQALANGCDPIEVMDAAARNEKLEIYYGNINPLKDGCKCVEEQQ